MMKDKIYFFMTSLYGWLIIVLVGICFIPAYTGDLLRANLILSATDVISILFLFVWLYLRVKLQLKRDVTWRDYLLVFVINIIYIVTISYMNPKMFLWTFLWVSLFFVFLDSFIYVMKHINIKNIFFYVISVISVLFLLYIDLMFFLYTIFFCFVVVSGFLDVFNGILRNI